MEITDYLDYIKYERKLSSETVKNYKYDLLKFSNFLKEKNIDSFVNVSQKDIEE